MNIFTIGVYGFERRAFIRAISDANIDVFIDTRRRRGVRGAQYSFANSQMLQADLAALGVRYWHELSLAPSKELIAYEDAHSRKHGSGRRKRTELTPEFREKYRDQCLATFDFSHFFALPQISEGNIAFFCVEKLPSACHRGLIAEFIEERFQCTVRHLLPCTQ